MAQEIERKFMVKDDSYKRLSHKSYRIAQGYICSRHSTARIRIRDNEAFLTIKSRSHDGGLSRFEWERTIPLRCAEWLLGRCKGHIVDKRRWLVEVGEFTYEVDEFAGENSGLTIAEVELRTATDTPPIPDWLGSEVTGIKYYHNSFLAAHPYKEWL